jgi:hypothetical protein
VSAVDDGDKSNLSSGRNEQRHLLALMKIGPHLFRPSFVMFNDYHNINPAIGAG